MCTTKSVVGLTTTPVGRRTVLDVHDQRLSDLQMLPLTPPRWSVETLDPLSATQSGDVAFAACPQGFTRFGSVIRATPGMSEIRLVCWYWPTVDPALATTGIATARLPQPPPARRPSTRASCGATVRSATGLEILLHPSTHLLHASELARRRAGRVPASTHADSAGPRTFPAQPKKDPIRGREEEQEERQCLPTTSSRGRIEASVASQNWMAFEQVHLSILSAAA